MRMYQMQEKIPNTRENTKKDQGDKDGKKKATRRDDTKYRSKYQGDEG